MKTTKILFLAMIIMNLVFISCSKDDKDDEAGEAVLSLRMTDAPGAYDAVYVDIQAVEVTGNNGTVNLNVNAGIYNLLDFTNGVDTLIAMGTIPAGDVEQIRLILGSNNTVVVDGVSHPLSTPSAQQSGLKLQIHREFLPGIAYMLLLDFDAHQSIVEQGNGGYSLKPVIRVVESAISGSITGTIVPPSYISSVTAEANGLQYSTYSNTSGTFLLVGVPQGIYTVTVTPPDTTITPAVFTNVNVTNGNVTDVGVVNF